LTTAYANDGLWGKGIYFAVNANYSCPGYSWKVPGQPNVYQVFLCEVLIGNYFEAGSNTDRSLREPPFKPGQTVRHDSVRAFTGGSVVHMVYMAEKCVPRYLITYSL